MYDVVEVPCPNCEQLYRAQSKSGKCEGEHYSLKDAPAEVMMDVNRHAPFQCDCGCVFYVTFKVQITERKASRLTDPGNLILSME